MNRYVGLSKTYLHLAVEQINKQIVSYLLFDAKVDPNKLTLQTLLSPLHIAIQLNALDIIEMLMECEKTDVNVISPTQGTPLHMACSMEKLQIV